MQRQTIILGDCELTLSVVDIGGLNVEEEADNYDFGVGMCRST